MKNLSSFNEFSLTRSEMKRVVGGCQVCSMRKDGPGGTCSGGTMSYQEAQSMANDFNSNPPESAGNYYYYAVC